MLQKCCGDPDSLAANSGFPSIAPATGRCRASQASKAKDVVLRRRSWAATELREWLVAPFALNLISSWRWKQNSSQTPLGSYPVCTRLPDFPRFSLRWQQHWEPLQEVEFTDCCCNVATALPIVNGRHFTWPPGTTHMSSQNSKMSLKILNISKYGYSMPSWSFVDPWKTFDLERPLTTVTELQLPPDVTRHRCRRTFPPGHRVAWKHLPVEFI